MLHMRHIIPTFITPEYEQDYKQHHIVVKYKTCNLYVEVPEFLK